MAQDSFVSQLTPSSETLTPDETRLIAPFFTNPDRSIVALKNLPEVIKGALFSRYSRSTKGVRRLFLDEFLVRGDLGIENFSRGTDHLSDQVSEGEEKAEDFYRRVLSDYGDDSVAELGGAHVACQEVSQIAARAIETGRVGISYLEKSSRYVPFDDKVNGQYRYYRPRRIVDSKYASEYIAAMDMLFEAYARHLPRMIEHITQQFPIENIEFENALTGEVARYAYIRGEDVLRSAQFAYRQSVRARACDMLRCFLPMATLTNVGVWGNGRALEYMLVKLYANPLDEVQAIARAIHHELNQVIGPFLKRANDERGKTHQSFLQEMSTRQGQLAKQFLPATPGGVIASPKGAKQSPSASGIASSQSFDSAEFTPSNVEGLRSGSLLAMTNTPKVTLVDYDADAVDRVVAAILFPGSDLPKTEIVARARELSDDEKAQVVRTFVGERQNRRHKPGRAFEHASYDFDLLLNIGEYRDLQRHRIVTSDRQMFTTVHGYAINDDVNAVAEIRADYVRCMEQTATFRDRLAAEMPFEAQYVVPFGFRVRYNVRLNLREACHWIELRSAPQGHPDYRNTSQEMFRAIQSVHPLLAETMKFVDLTPDVPLGRLRAEMRRMRKIR